MRDFGRQALAEHSEALPCFICGTERRISARGTRFTFWTCSFFLPGWLVIWAPDVTPNSESKRNRQDSGPSSSQTSSPFNSELSQGYVCIVCMYVCMYVRMYVWFNRAGQGTWYDSPGAAQFAKTPSSGFEPVILWSCDPVGR